MSDEISPDGWIVARRYRRADDEYTVRISMPLKDDVDYFCVVRVDEPAGQKDRRAHGVDEWQALQLAFQLADALNKDAVVDLED